MRRAVLIGLPTQPLVDVLVTGNTPPAITTVPTSRPVRWHRPHPAHASGMSSRRTTTLPRWNCRTALPARSSRAGRGCAASTSMA